MPLRFHACKIAFVTLDLNEHPSPPDSKRSFQLRPALISSPSRLLALFDSDEWKVFGGWVARLINCCEIVLTKAFLLAVMCCTAHKSEPRCSTSILILTLSSESPVTNLTRRTLSTERDSRKSAQSAKFSRGASFFTFSLQLKWLKRWEATTRIVVRTFSVRYVSSVYFPNPVAYNFPLFFINQMVLKKLWGRNMFYATQSSHWQQLGAFWGNDDPCQISRVSKWALISL